MPEIELAKKTFDKLSLWMDYIQRLSGDKTEGEGRGRWITNH